MNKMSSCKFCNEIFNSKSIGGHTKYCKLNPSREDSLRNLSQARSCITEDSRERMKVGLRRAWENGSYSETIESRKGKPGRIHSSESKIKMSRARKEWLAENPNQHPWKRSTKFESEPCQKLKEVLSLREIEFIEEFTPLDDRFFSIDIAFPTIKVGIEINGEQHYNRDGSLKKYYQERHNLIESAGWKLYEIHYSICYKQNKIDEIVDSIAKNHNLQNIDLSYEIKKKEKTKTRKFPNHQAYAESQQLSQESLRTWKAAIDSVDITKHGFIGKIAKEMKCSHTHVRRIVKRYFPDLECFHRKSRRNHEQL